MTVRTDKDIDAIMKDGERVGAALTAGVRAALVRHVQAGAPVVEWRDGKCVWIGPEEITRRIEEIDRKNGG
ncbi:MAG: hypothetical protein R6V58_16470 [Planctomycetota bacterium]